MDEARGSATSSLAAYIGVVRRRWPLVVLVLVIVPATAVALSLNQQKLFQASAQVLITDQTPQEIFGSPTVTQPVDPTRRANTEIAVARVPIVAQRTLASLGISDRSPVDLLQHTSVTAASDADVLTVAVTDPNPGLATRLVNQYATEFIRYQKQLDTASVRAALQGVDARITSLKAQIASGATGDPAQADELRSLLGRQQALETQENLQGGKLFVIRRASGGTQVQPNVTRNGLAGIGLGLILGVAIAFLVHALDTRVRATDEASEILRLPLLGRLPTPPRRLRRQAGLAMLDARAGSHVDAYQNLRTSFDLANLKTRAKTVLVTSAVASEGKSTTTANLAIALARSGRRVAVVDLDLRDPYIARLFRVDGQPGVTGVATGAVRIQDALVGVPVHRRSEPGGSVETNGGRPVGADGVLDVLPSGVTPPDPVAFLSTGELRAIVDHLREAYDIVLIDSPPALPVGDAMTMSDAVDAVLVIVRAGVVRRASLAELRRLLDAAPCEKLGFVLTGSESTPAYGYGYGAYGGAAPIEIEGVTGSPRS